MQAQQQAEEARIELTAVQAELQALRAQLAHVPRPVSPLLRPTFDIDTVHHPLKSVLGKSNCLLHVLAWVSRAIYYIHIVPCAMRTTLQVRLIDTGLQLFVACACHVSLLLLQLTRLACSQQK